MRALAREFICLALVLALSACSEIRETAPDRTANEQLLISTAADRAIERLTFGIPNGGRTFVDATHFDSYDEEYVIGGVREKLAADGAELVRTRADAEFIVEIRSGGLSINQRRDYIGIGGFEMPVPLSEAVQLPLASFYEENDRTGLAKFDAATYHVDGYRIVHTSGPVFGVSWIDKRTLFGVGWRNTNVMPESLQDGERPDGTNRHDLDLIPRR